MTKNLLDPSQEPQPKPKGLKLSDLFPAKTPIETSIGTLYVRKALTIDWKAFENDEALELGKKAVKLLSSRIEDKESQEQLLQEDLEALNDTDFEALALGISVHNGWGEISSDAGLIELGNNIAAAKKKKLESQKAAMEELRKSISSSYGFLAGGVLEKLQEQMAGISNLRNNILHSDTLSAAARIADLAARPKVFEEKASLVKPLDLGRPNQLIPRFEDSPLGRATLESVKNSRETAQKMNDLVDVVAGLNQTLIKDVLPAWFDQVEQGQNGAKVAIRQAAKSLQWTKWAVIVSVLVTALATGWQVYVAFDLDRENSEQQKRTDEILLKQLAGQQQFIKQQERTQELLLKQLTVQQQLIEQQVRDAASMRKAIATLKPSTLAVAPKKPHR